MKLSRESDFWVLNWYIQCKISYKYKLHYFLLFEMCSSHHGNYE